MSLLLQIQIDFSKMIPWISTFIDGTIVTIVISLITVIFGTLIGLILVFFKQTDAKILHAFVGLYTRVIQGTPVLLQLFIWLYALPLIGIAIQPVAALGSVYGSREFLTAVIALSINSGAYVAEIFRGGLESVDKGQMEAGRSLGLSKSKTLRYVIIPQAVKVALPGLGNEFITMIKESSVVSVVGVFDVMYTNNIVKSATYSVFEPLIIVGIIYLILTSVLTFLLQKLEVKLNGHS